MSNRSTRPYAVVGAKNLTASLYKIGSESDGFQYRFNFTRLNTQSGRVGHWFFPRDLLPILKLTCVLAAELESDGCLKNQVRLEIRNIAHAVDHAINMIVSEQESGRTVE